MDKICLIAALLFLYVSSMLLVGSLRAASKERESIQIFNAEVWYQPDGSIALIKFK